MHKLKLNGTKGFEEVNTMATRSDELQKKEAMVPEGVERTRRRNVFVPNTDIYEDTENLYLVADMPGVDVNHVDITLEKNVLTISGTVEEASPVGHEIAYREYPVGDYQRAFTISNEIDRNAIKAKVRDGVLELTLPKAETVKPRQITVQAG